MNVEAVSGLVVEFAERHKVTFSEISGRQSVLLELGAIIAVQQHYRASGFQIQILNPTSSSQFVVKTSTRGGPWKYSRVRAIKKGHAVDIHMNLAVRGAHGSGIYCVDVGITSPDTVPSNDSSQKWLCLENRYLRSFAEVKRLPIYPMLLAQFVGIVHEIKPRFLQGPIQRRFGRNGHLPPALIVLGRFSGNSHEIVNEYASRGFQVIVAENFDMRIASALREPMRSPFFLSEDLSMLPTLDSHDDVGRDNVNH